MMVVVSVGLSAPTKDKCIQSVREQFVHPTDVRHDYIEAGVQVPRLGSIENFYSAVHELDPEDIVVSLDGDDWLSDPFVLSKVQAMHDAGAWVTYGSFACGEPRPFRIGNAKAVTTSQGFCRAYAPGEDWRKGPWGASHLKTFRAGLFQRIKKADLMTDDGKEWLFVRDMAIMFPMLEMAGHARVTYCKDILCVYSTTASTTRTPEETQWEARDDKLIRSRPRYALLGESFLGALVLVCALATVRCGGDVAQPPDAGADVVTPQRCHPPGIVLDCDAPAVDCSPCPAFCVWNSDAGPPVKGGCE